MSHPHSRAARRSCRTHKIVSRSLNIRWARCHHCFPAPCHCKENAGRHGRLAKTPVPCSCVMCGNPRRVFHALSLEERRALTVSEGLLETSQM